MKRLPQILALVTVLGATSAAHAGGYVSLGIGAEASLSGDMAQHFTTDGDDNGSGRIALGQRNGRFAFEVALYGADVQSVSQVGERLAYSIATLGVAAKYFFPLTGRLEAYGKAGLDKTWLVGEDGAPAEHEGRGYNLGGGLQYSFSGVLLGDAGIWLDYTHQSFELHDDVKRDLDGGAQMLTVGVSIGF